MDQEAYSELSETFIVPSHPNPGRMEKIELNFYFRIFLWCLKRFYEVTKNQGFTLSLQYTLAN